MSETPWTKGPWSLTTSEPPGQWVMSSGTAMGPGRLQRQDVGRFMGGSTTPPETAEANARLISAAPELYAALEAAEGHLKETLEDPRWHPIHDCPVLCQVQRALAKARGGL